jgi:hypothetical protein
LQRALAYAFEAGLIGRNACDREFKILLKKAGLPVISLARYLGDEDLDTTIMSIYVVCLKIDSDRMRKVVIED